MNRNRIFADYHSGQAIIQNYILVYSQATVRLYNGCFENDVKQVRVEKCQMLILCLHGNLTEAAWWSKKNGSGLPHE